MKSTKASYGGRQHTSIGVVRRRDQGPTFTVNGFSKAYSMTGWRLGTWPRQNGGGSHGADTGPKHLEPDSFAQAGAVAALTGPQDAVEEMRRHSRERRDVIVGPLNAIPGVQLRESDGGSYVFPTSPDFSTPDRRQRRAAEYLLAEARIAVVPGSGFGAPEYIRLSYPIDGADRRGYRSTGGGRESLRTSGGSEW